MKSSSIVRQLNGVLNQLISYCEDEQEEAQLFEPSEYCEILTSIIGSVKDASDQPVVWVRGLLGRIGYLSSSENTQSVQSNLPFDKDVAELAGIDSYGCFSMKQDLTLHDVLMPWSFQTELTSFNEARIKAVQRLERTISLLGCANPENWCSSDKLGTYMCLVDYCVSTPRFIQLLKLRDGKFFQKYERLENEDIAVCVPDSLKTLQSVPKGTKCYLSNVAFDSIPDPSKWTVIPAEFIRDKTIRNQQYAMKELVQLLVQCRDKAKADADHHAVSLHSK
jgi:hypothetical protein